MNIYFLITMNYAYEHLEKGVLKPQEYEQFLDKMYAKYKDEETRLLYQNKLDIYLNKSVNVPVKGDDL